MLDAVKKYRKGQKDKLDFLDDLPGESKNKGNKNSTDKFRYDDESVKEIMRLVKVGEPSYPMSVHHDIQLTLYNDFYILY